MLRTLTPALIAVGLTACGGLESHLLDTLRKDGQRPLCVSPGILGVDAFEANDRKRYLAKVGSVSFWGTDSNITALDALTEAGYADAEPVSLPKTFASFFDAYEITSKGNEYFRDNEFATSIQVCIGEKVATDILEYTEPGDSTQAFTQARFRYRLDFNDLIDDLGIEAELRAALSRDWPGEGSGVFVKTSEGWRLEKAVWR